MNWACYIKSFNTMKTDLEMQQINNSKGGKVKHY